MEASDFLRAHYCGRDIVMLDCFWAYANYPLGEFMNVRFQAVDGNFDRLHSEIIQVGLCIFSKEHPDPVTFGLRESFKECIVFNNSLYTIIAVRED